MKTDIQSCRELNNAGIVLQILSPENKIDIEHTLYLIDLTHPMQVTSRKAFDETPDYLQTLEFVISIGANRILTSETKPKEIKP